jgi:hypothetical protein
MAASITTQVIVLFFLNFMFSVSHATGSDKIAGNALAPGAQHTSVQSRVIWIPENGKSTYLAASSSEVKEIIGFYQSRKDEEKIASIISERATQICKYHGGKLLDFELGSSDKKNQFYSLNQGRRSVVDSDSKISAGHIALDAGAFLITGGVATLIERSALRIATAVGGETLLNFGVHTALKQLEKLDLKGMYNYKYVYFKNLACIPSEGINSLTEDAIRLNHFCPKSAILQTRCNSIPAYKDFVCMEQALQRKYSFEWSTQTCQKFTENEAVEAGDVFDFCRQDSASTNCIQQVKGSGPAVLKSCDDYINLDARLKCIEFTKGHSPTEINFCSDFNQLDARSICYQGLPKKTDEAVLKSCDNYINLDARLKCVEFTNGHTPSEINFCSDFNQLDARSVCYQGLPKKTDEAALKSCRDYNTLDTRLKCLSGNR